MKDLFKKLGPGDLMYYIGMGVVVISLFTSILFMIPGLLWMVIGERSRTTAMLKRLPPEEKDLHV